ncbi:MAG: nucleotide pyrophosphohydrolase [Clostridia bacterium]|nr:nucleotide pyrophosphohydrolase [Clostridia bacterium]
MNGFDLKEAMEALIRFRNERDWEQYHTPKNLSMSIAIEAAELMEHFQWKHSGEGKESLGKDEFDKIQEEISDVAAYLLMLTHDLGIDLNKAMLDKIKKNALKYPVDKCRGKSDKYDNL